jgi:excinuclease UvrABC nuclease subunit
MMSEAVPGIFDASLTFDPAGDFEAFLKAVPAKWVVYLMTDAEDRPVQLLCVKNLRMSLKRRLGPEEPDAGRSKRVNYRELVRHVHYRRVDSAFEADWLYYEAARQVFPQTYQGMVGFRPAWFIHVNPQTNFPRYVKTIDISGQTGVYFGPLEDKHAAARLIELMEDAFDLCRYYSVLIESPRGRACAYKEMGKCPAPCDGSISMESYRRLIDLSVQTLIDPRPMLREQEKRMRDAAGDLRFEVAGKIKQYTEKLGELGKGQFRHVRPLGDFRFLCLQHGPTLGTAKAFVITPGHIAHVATMLDEPTIASSLLRLVFEIAQQPMMPPLSKDQAERIGVVSHHLFIAKSAHGVFLPLAEVNDKTLIKAFRDLMKQKRPEESEGEGVVKELQAME